MTEQQAIQKLKRYARKHECEWAIGGSLADEQYVILEELFGNRRLWVAYSRLIRRAVVSVITEHKADQ